MLNGLLPDNLTIRIQRGTDVRHYTTRFAGMPRFPNVTSSLSTKPWLFKGI